MQSIDGSHILLVPKIGNPTKVGDYRPISLLNSSIKLLTKILASKLHKVITKLLQKKINMASSWTDQLMTVLHRPLSISIYARNTRKKW
jgi:hypothetical protein